MKAIEIEASPVGLLRLLEFIGENEKHEYATALSGAMLHLFVELRRSCVTKLEASVDGQLWYVRYKMETVVIAEGKGRTFPLAILEAGVGYAGWMQQRTLKARTELN